MSSTRKKVVTGLAVAFVVAAVVAPSAGARVDISAAEPTTSGSDTSKRTATELGQSTNPSGDLSERTATELAQSTNLGGDLSERTATELAQSTNLGGDFSERTATELAQSTNLAPSPAPSGGSSGFDWGDAAIVGGGALGLALIGLGGAVVFTRRRGRIQRSRTPVVSS
jgi:hypothetical protein